MSKKQQKPIPFSKAEDAFQRTSKLIIQRLSQRKMLFFIIFTLPLLLGGFFATKKYYRRQNEIEIQNQLYLSTSKWEALKKSTSLPTSTQNILDQAQNNQKTIILNEDDYRSLRLGYEEIIQNHKGTKGAILAALNLAHLHITQGDPKAALNSMQQVQSTLNSESFIDGMALMSLAHLYEANQKCQEGVKIWSRVIDSPWLSFFHADALLKQGLCFEEMKATDQAYQNYQKLKMDYGQSPSGQMAQRLLHLMAKK